MNPERVKGEDEKRNNHREIIGKKSGNVSFSKCPVQ